MIFENEAIALSMVVIFIPFCDLLLVEEEELMFRVSGAYTVYPVIAGNLAADLQVKYG